MVGSKEIKVGTQMEVWFNFKRRETGGPVTSLSGNVN